MPKFHLLYLKNLFDICLNKFFEMYNDCFIKQNQKYVLVKDISKTKLKHLFLKLLTYELKSIVKEYDKLKPNYYILIGSCLPKDNLLLNYRDNKYFPKKIDSILNTAQHLKYVLKERDIDINILRFNDICIELANAFLKKDAFKTILGEKFKNVIFIQHKQIDCYVMFKMLKSIYGKRNCINTYAELFSDRKLPLIALNDIIQKYANKAEFNKSDTLKNIREEIKQFINERIRDL